MKVRAEQLAGSLQRGLAPVYLIGGEEPLLLQECLWWSVLQVTLVLPLVVW